MKRCNKCKLFLSTNNFSSNKTSKDGLQHYCKNCMNEISIQCYFKHKATYFKRAKERDIALDKLINSYKDKACMDCGKKYPPFVMDFDHLDSSIKISNICAMRRRRMAFAKIIAEIKKCDVVCSNCHRIRSNKRQPARYMK